MQSALEILPQHLDLSLKSRGGDILAACLRIVGVEATFGALRSPGGSPQTRGTVQAVSAATLSCSTLGRHPDALT